MKRKNNSKAWLISLGFSLLVAAFFLSLFYLAPKSAGAWIHFLERKFLDIEFTSVARPIDPDPSIVIVSINNTALREMETTLGRWPWPRRTMGEIIEYLNQAGALAIGVDILYAERSINDPKGDLYLAEQIKKAGNVILACVIPEKGNPMMPFDDLLSQAANIGDISLAEDPDGTTRRYRLINQNTSTQTLGLAFAVAQQAKRTNLEIDPHVVNEDGTIWVNWYGPQDTFTYVDAHKLLEARAQSLEPSKNQNLHEQALHLFKDKIVLIGVTAAGLFDLRINPFSSVYPGVETHATVVSNLLNSQFIRPTKPHLAIFYVLILSALTGLWFSKLQSSVVEALTLSLMMLVVSFVSWALFYFKSTFIPLALPLMCVFVIAAAHMIWHYFVEGRDRRYLKKAFSKYINEEVMQTLLEDPKNLELGGKNSNLTILFSDIRGFTQLSENLRPDEVVSLLNEYLTAMVDIVFEHGGTLDKFIGDAVMAFWGAPIASANHADLAVKAGLQMLSKTAELSEKWQLSGKPKLQIGIGINTGVVTVGNIGSNRSQSYTVIGDEVNLASRLESLNKEMKTQLIVSESTFLDLSFKEELQLKNLGEVKVKGKEKLVRIYGI